MMTLNTNNYLNLRITYILCLVFTVSSCGLGYERTKAIDQEYTVTSKNRYIWDKDIDEILSDPTLTKDFRDGSEVYIFDKRTTELPDDNYVYILIPFHLSTSEINQQTEYYYKDNKLIKVFLRNSTYEKEGAGFFCTPFRNYWGGNDDVCKGLP